MAKTIMTASNRAANFYYILPIVLPVGMIFASINCYKGYMKKYMAGGGTIIISSHEECELSVCTKMYLMKGGVLESLNGSCSLSSIMERMVK